MRKYRLKQTVSILLSMILAFSCMNAMAPVRAADESEPDAVLVACSDFQNFDDSNNGAYSGSYTNNIALVKRILNAMQYERIDGFLCGGDYNFAETINSVSQTQTGIDAVRNAVTDIYPTLPDERIVLVQGNHDATGTSGMASTGPYETDHYSIYVINEDDYMDRNTDEARIKATSEALAAWLEQKCEEDYDRPVFVATHLPLHFTTRTQKNGDGQYARYLELSYFYRPVQYTRNTWFFSIYSHYGKTQYYRDRPTGYNNYRGGRNRISGSYYKGRDYDKPINNHYKPRSTDMPPHNGSSMTGSGPGNRLTGNGGSTTSSSRPQRNVGNGNTGRSNGGSNRNSGVTPRRSSSQGSSSTSTQKGTFGGKRQ